MKKLLFVAFATISSIAFAQKVDFGVKGGLVFNTDKGKVLSGIEKIIDDKGSGSTGFQAGLLSRISLPGFYIQPELLYTQFKNKYSTKDESFKITKNRIDLPVNFGKSVFNIGHVQAGPVFSYYLDDGISLNEIKRLKQDDFNVGFQLGAGVNLSSLLIDLRYEYGFGKITSTFINTGTSFSTETRPSFLNLTIGYLF
jgi:opacity protein-like surface antigen